LSLLSFSFFIQLFSNKKRRIYLSESESVRREIIALFVVVVVRFPLFLLNRRDHIFIFIFICFGLLQFNLMIANTHTHDTYYQLVLLWNVIMMSELLFHLRSLSSNNVVPVDDMIVKSD